MMRHWKYIGMMLTAMLWASCGNEDEPLTDTVGQEVTEEAQTRFAATDDAITRTLLDNKDGSYKFYWRMNDKVWLLKDAATKDYVQSRRSNIMQEQQEADFFFVGHYNEEQYPIYYTGLEMHNTDASTGLTPDGKLPNTNGSSATQVTIAPVQVQYLPNQGQHIATSGDCATATAVKEPESSTAGYQYKFTLNHRASYLIFKPYTVGKPLVSHCYLLKIKVRDIGANGRICGTYEFGNPDVNGGGLNLSSNVTNARDSILLYCTTFMQKPLNAAKTDYDWAAADTYDENIQHRFQLQENKASANAANMVIEPGSHKLEVTYTVTYFRKQKPVFGSRWNFSATENIKEFKIVIDTREYQENNYYTIQHRLDLSSMEPRFVFDFYHYYEWNAAEHYWKGQEGNIPNVNDMDRTFTKDASSVYAVTNRPTNNQATAASFSTLPNANEMTYYLKHGDIHLGDDVLWWVPNYVVGGENNVLCSGGLWMMKKAKISATFSDSKDAINGNDLRTYGNWDAGGNDKYKVYFYEKPGFNYIPATSRQSPAADGKNENDYFFLPNMGYFETKNETFNLNIYNVTAKLKLLGAEGNFWSSTKYPEYSPTHAWRNTAYSFYIMNKPQSAGGQYAALSWQPDASMGVNWYPRQRFGFIAGKRPTSTYTHMNGDVIDAGGTEWFQ